MVPTDPAAPVAVLFDELRRAYAARLPARLAELTAFVESVLASGAAEPLREAAARAHALAGSAGSYGLPRVGDAARDLEEALLAPAAPDRPARLASALATLLARASAEVATGGVSGP